MPHLPKETKSDGLPTSIDADLAAPCPDIQAHPWPARTRPARTAGAVPSRPRKSMPLNHARRTPSTGWSPCVAAMHQQRGIGGPTTGHALRHPRPRRLAATLAGLQRQPRQDAHCLLLMRALTERFHCVLPMPALTAYARSRRQNAAPAVPAPQPCPAAAQPPSSAPPP
jgi:hypothetical protein